MSGDKLQSDSIAGTLNHISNKNRITDVISNKNRTSLEYPAKIIYKKIITPIESSVINKDFERLILICCNVKYGFLMKYIQNKNTKNPANTTIITFSYIRIQNYSVLCKDSTYHSLKSFLAAVSESGGDTEALTILNAASILS